MGRHFRVPHHCLSRSCYGAIAPRNNPAQVQCVYRIYAPNAIYQQTMG